ncbi:Exonuclease_VII [Hexamita inflata]|uniref:Small subunit superfamily n=1 Tax=Hexamita inflata TaxID=28002 RepID=A0AA86QF52_9EUKA|nr:Exonuclease VII [Hexamita inflata]CAI9951889.1 Exonuclease VII [Hexamita inflata]CAI9956957.1 Exonuclease VII [Hexamita inflata]
MSSFDQNVEELQKILDILETQELTDEQAQKYIQKAENLKQKCALLLADEKNEIVKIARANDINPDELGL